MRNCKTAMLAALIGLTASFAVAQETETAAPDDQVVNTAPATSTDDLNMGTEVVETPALGTPYIRETSGDWSVRCLTSEPDVEDPCQLYQLLFDNDGNSVAEISMFPLRDGGRAAAGATIVVPLETLLPEQITLNVDGSAKRRYPLTFCNRAGCVARIGFTQEEVDQFKRGNAGLLRMVPAAAPDQEVNLNISLTGFTAGYNTLN